MSLAGILTCKKPDHINNFFKKYSQFNYYRLTKDVTKEKPDSDAHMIVFGHFIFLDTMHHKSLYLYNFSEMSIEIGRVC